MSPRVPGARNIFVLRPNAIGDFMFALPALHALRHAYPEANIVFAGKDWHADFLQDRPRPMDEVLVMPPVPGVGAPPDARCDPSAIASFVGAMRERRFDLALQMYGGGRYSNAFIMSLGAGLTVGARTSDAAPLDRSIAYGAIANRRLELLEIVGLAGAYAVPVEHELTSTDADRSLARTLLPASRQPIVIVHPGVGDPRRRWPAVRFAAVADALADAGALIVLSAAIEDAALSQQVASAMRHRPLDLSGKLTLPALCGVLERSALMVSNDTGPMHLSLSVGTPAVAVFWLTNLLEACPLRQQLLRPALSVRVHCPVCGKENRHQRCEHNVCFVDDVETGEVTELALSLFRERR